MNTYRVYVLDTRQPLEPHVIVAYARGEKYGEAWKASNHVLAGEPKSGEALFLDEECKQPFPPAFKGEDFKTAKVADLRPRNAKLDRTALIAILQDSTKSAEEKVAAAQALTAGQGAQAA